MRARTRRAASSNLIHRKEEDHLYAPLQILPSATEVDGGAEGHEQGVVQSAVREEPVGAVLHGRTRLSHGALGSVRRDLSAPMTVSQRRSAHFHVSTRQHTKSSRLGQRLQERVIGTCRTVRSGLALSIPTSSASSGRRFCAASAIWEWQRPWSTRRARAFRSLTVSISAALARSARAQPPAAGTFTIIAPAQRNRSWC